MTRVPLGWLGIARLGLVQTALGAIVVLTTSTMNRVMVVELSLPAVLPGALIALHYALQVLRPRWGYGSDVGGRHTPWIISGMAALALGGIGTSLATAVLASNVWAGTALAIAAFCLVGIGVGAAGTSLLTLLATSVDASRRGAAATIVWMMMIAGFVVTTIVAGRFLDPFSISRLVAVTSTVSVVAFVVAAAALWNIEPKLQRLISTPQAPPAETRNVPFRTVIAEVWDEPQARRFTIFVFTSMLAYSMQDLILEPFAGIAFNLTVGETTQLSGIQHGGVFAGMLLVAIAGHPRIGIGSLRSWTIAGCIASGCALMGPALAGVIGAGWSLRAIVFALGVSNRSFAVAAIGTMLGLSANGGKNRDGVRMGLWGAAQAIAFGAGGFIGAVTADILRHVVATPSLAYKVTFTIEAVLFLGAAMLAQNAIPRSRNAGTRTLDVSRQSYATEFG
jgi:BCD family chlorophyll transporter-like MFS transporter